MAVNNIPDYADKYRYWVVNEVEGDIWFYAAYNDLRQASETLVNLARNNYEKPFIVENAG